MGKPMGDSGSAVDQLYWHLNTSEWYGANSERRRKDSLRLQFGALMHGASAALMQEIRALNPLERNPRPESAALRRFRRSLSGPRFRREFETWYANEVDRSPLRAWVADHSGDVAAPARMQELVLPTNGRPRLLATLTITAQRRLIRAAIAEVTTALRATSNRRATQARAREQLARQLGMSVGSLMELERRPRKGASR